MSPTMPNKMIAMVGPQAVIKKKIKLSVIFYKKNGHM
jgi:hypothetical protein